MVASFGVQGWRVHDPLRWHARLIEVLLVWRGYLCGRQVILHINLLRLDAVDFAQREVNANKYFLNHKLSQN